ncbi:X-linked retinitis pigmentosa GTPase regulator [Yersinia phage fHe-Yen9-04]|uniref:X-linked retinitis pigmentosa GTPase regulator n=1 Tax=Yersinia phage fHe-Yen9-04 TaxID=2052742 RepID=A0A2C9CZK2_9CAUD|nr:regulator of chromosome condensation [Yersinia phage fHe-Yen9-04]SOK58808.1 X-linked retinitis pigmentosa GTPase regulator [Yersinia phage fHe-Yen9-04]VUE36577.1 X-linked retinitis pigmentosa GTPase regulator [Yersinia phage fHe-Yen9-04]
MLPFSIISHYGNIIIKSQIKKIVSSYQTIALLYSNGNLYMRGTNQLRAFGIDHASDSLNWVLVKTGVDDVWVGPTHTIIRTSTGEYQCAGYFRPLGYDDSPQGKLWVRYDKLYTLTSTPETTVKQICCGSNSTFILLTNGILYGIGFNNQYWLGADSTYRTTYTQSLSNVRSVHHNTNASFAITNDNKLYGTGNSVNGKLGTNMNTIQQGWTEIALPSPYTYPIQAKEHPTHSLLYASTDSTMQDTRILFCGNTSANPGGRIPAWPNNTVFVFTIGNGGQNGSVQDFATGIVQTVSQTLKSFYYNNSSLYGAGLAGYQMGSSTDRSTGFSTFNLGTEIGSISSAHVVNGCTFILSNNTVYGCGTSTWLGINTYDFIIVSTPE